MSDDDEYKVLIHHFIAFLIADMATEIARRPLKRMDIHAWMIKYLQDKLDKEFNKD